VNLQLCGITADISQRPAAEALWLVLLLVTTGLIFGSFFVPKSPAIAELCVYVPQGEIVPFSFIVCSLAVLFLCGCSRYVFSMCVLM